MPTVVWTPTAVADVKQHYQDLKPKDPDTAKRATQAILRAGDSLEENPRRGTVIQQAQGLRELQVFLAISFNCSCIPRCIVTRT